MVGKNVQINVFLDVNANTKKAKKAMTKFDKSMQGLSKGLVIMFAGQAVQRGIQGITDNVKQLVGIEDIRNAMYTDLLLPSVLKEMDAKLELFDLTSQLSDAEKETIGDTLLGTEKIAGVVASAGQAIAAAGGLGKSAGAAFALGLTAIENIDAIETAMGYVLMKTDVDEKMIEQGSTGGEALVGGIIAGSATYLGEKVIDFTESNLVVTFLKDTGIVGSDAADNLFSSLKDRWAALVEVGSLAAPKIGGGGNGGGSSAMSTIVNITGMAGGLISDLATSSLNPYTLAKSIGTRVVSSRGRTGA